MSLRVTVVESAFATSNHYLVVNFLNALRMHPEISELRLVDVANALRVTSGEISDVLIVFGGEQAGGHVVGNLRARSRFSVVWYLEDPYEIEQNLLTRPFFDFAVSNDKHSCNSVLHEVFRHV